MQERLQLTKYCAQPAGGIQIGHVVLPGRLEIDQYRRGIRELIQPAQIDMDGRAAGDGGEMDDGVGRAADRDQHA